MCEQVQPGLTACYKKPLDTVSWSPASLKFTKRKVGTISTALKVTLTNKQRAALTGISISAFGDFTEPAPARHRSPSTRSA